jgi:trans-aconitate 2-methyltransferase
MSWSASQYLAFEDARTRPVRDLLNAVPTREARAVVDLGCGPGNSTEVLASRFPGALVTGVDNSPEMIAAARQRLPRIRFTQTAIQVWDEPGPFDTILANAVLQWVPDHGALLPRLICKLASSGSLAVQMPDNLDEPAHRLMRDVAANGPWAEALAGAAGTRAKLGTPSWYYEVLRPYCTRVDVWRTTYFHPLPEGAGGIVEWFKGSGLRPFLAPLGEAVKAAYLDRYGAALAEAYPPLPDGTVLLPFPRLFVVATR